MEIGRNIKNDGRNYIAFRYTGEKTIRKWYFNSHRAAMRKFNQVKQNADWLPIHQDVTI